MATTRMSDVSYLLLAGSDKSFDDAVSAPSMQYWKDAAFVTPATKQVMNFDTMGALGPAQRHNEENPPSYQKIEFDNRTQITCYTEENGFKTSQEATMFDLYDRVKKYSGKPLLDTLVARKEKQVATIYDNMFTSTGADGVYYASNSHPLKNDATKYNDNLMTAAALSDATLTSGKNQFYRIYNPAGRIFPTRPTHLLITPEKQSLALQILYSALVAYELSNTKNVQNSWEPIKIIVNPHISNPMNSSVTTYPWFLLDKTLEAGVTLTTFKGLSLWNEVDEESYVFKAIARETYGVGQIAPGFGVVANLGTSA